MKRNYFGPGTALLALVSVLALPAHAGQLRFDDDGIQSGVISYDGAGGPLEGFDIDFSTIRGVGTPLHDGDELVCEDCQLDFETGANITENDGDNWTWSGGGFFTLSGTAKEMGGLIVAVGDLVSGAWSGTVSLFGKTFVIGSGTDEKHPDLNAYFGVSEPAAWTFAQTEITFNLAVDADGGFTGTVDQADLINTVPEPATVALMGFGLLAAGAFTRRRRMAK